VRTWELYLPLLDFREPRSKHAENGATLFLTDATDLDAACRELPTYGLTLQSAQLGNRPKNTVALSDAEREEVEAFLEAIDAEMMVN
jgi:transcriptional/translational regulatory protein YebC/TACO1